MRWILVKIAFLVDRLLCSSYGPHCIQIFLATLCRKEHTQCWIASHALSLAYPVKQLFAPAPPDSSTTPQRNNATTCRIFQTATQPSMELGFNPTVGFIALTWRYNVSFCYHVFLNLNLNVSASRRCFFSFPRWRVGPFLLLLISGVCQMNNILGELTYSSSPSQIPTALPKLDCGRDDAMSLGCSSFFVKCSGGNAYVYSCQPGLVFDRVSVFSCFNL